MKQERHEKILEIIQNQDIGTQEELADRLIQLGFQVTQATVSRDIRELKLSKIPMQQGQQKYVSVDKQDGWVGDKYIRVLKAGYIGMDMAQNILVIKTVSGMAMGVAAALDAMKWSEIVGCIAGDDTIMCAVRSVEETVRVMEKLRSLLSK